jgi:hypothetical protein
MLKNASQHSFHIPVMGLGYTVDTPVKVAKFGISSVVSIMDDHLLEDMRRLYCRKNHLEYLEIKSDAIDSRSMRITAYLDLVDHLVTSQVEYLKQCDWNEDPQFAKYLSLIPQKHPIHNLLSLYFNAVKPDKVDLATLIKSEIVPGRIDVNIMTKVDKMNFDKEGNPLPREYSDALSALKGFTKSKVNGSVVFSAGMNPSLYGYAENFDCFFPDHLGKIQKGIILKVSDYRSALIQGRFLAKKGLFVSEFRIESGLNCGGHAFATDGFLVGTILEDFKTKRQELYEAIFSTCQQTLTQSNKNSLYASQEMKITYQGGIGTHAEDSFLQEYYQLDGTGWGSPFLLVPEATAVDSDTLDRILKSKTSDYFLSYASPLGVSFHNLRNSSGEEQRKTRIKKNRPGSPCYKKFLASNKEFTEKPICTASRQYQDLKVKAMATQNIEKAELDRVLEKDCLCEGLSAPGILSAGGTPRRNLVAVTICPGPNLAYFKSTYSLKEMVDHIYGKISLKLDPERPHVFVKELQLYVSYFKNEIEQSLKEKSQKQQNHLNKFRENLIEGISYYQELANSVSMDSIDIIQKMKSQFSQLKFEIESCSEEMPFEPTLS